MTHQAWYPKASKAQLFSGGVAQPTISKLVLHSTEGTGWPGYNGGASAPTFTVRPIWDEQRVEVRQHFAANVSAKALVDKAGGVRTNRDNVAQIEIVGTSGWATRRNKAAANGAKGTYVLGEQWYVADYPWWFWRDLGALVRWYHDEWELPLTGLAFPTWAGGGRLSDRAYDDYQGILGHSHVPENDHTDPGPIPVQTLLKYARDAGKITPAPAGPATPAAPAAPTDEEFIMAVEDKIVEALGKIEAKVGMDQSASDAYAAKLGAKTGEYVHAYLRDKGLTVKLDDETIAKLAQAIKEEGGVE